MLARLFSAPATGALAFGAIVFVVASLILLAHEAQP